MLMYAFFGTVRLSDRLACRVRNGSHMRHLPSITRTVGNAQDWSLRGRQPFGTPRVYMNRDVSTSTSRLACALRTIPGSCQNRTSAEAGSKNTLSADERSAGGGLRKLLGQPACAAGSEPTPRFVDRMACRLTLDLIKKIANVLGERHAEPSPPRWR